MTLRVVLAVLNLCETIIVEI